MGDMDAMEEEDVHEDSSRVGLGRYVWGGRDG